MDNLNLKGSIFFYTPFRALIGGGGSIFIYSCSPLLISFEMNLKTTDSKKIRRSEHEYMNINHTPPPPPPPQVTL